MFIWPLDVQSAEIDDNSQMDKQFNNLEFDAILLHNDGSLDSLTSDHLTRLTRPNSRERVKTIEYVYFPCLRAFCPFQFYFQRYNIRVDVVLEH